MESAKLHRYDSNREFLDKLGKDLLKAQREAGVYPPFDDTDASEYLLPRMFRGLSPGARKKLTHKKTRLHGKQFPRHADPVDLEDSLLLQSFEKFKLAPTVRKALGYDAPIPLERLGDELAKIEQGVDKKLAEGFWYPQHDYLGPELGPETGGLHIWELGLASLPNPPITWGWGNQTFKDHVDSVSETLNCHPALALAFLLCDTPVHRDSVTVVLPPYAYLFPDQNISLYVGRPQVAVWLVAWMYRLARQMVLLMNNRGKPIAKSPRPRAETKRVASLISLIGETKRLKWGERLRRWNEEHPEWKYDNVNSMRAVYYRAKAARARAKGKVRQNRLAKGGKSHGES
jgi:hypothetical protein